MKIMWLIFAILSSVFAALTSILAKIGIDGVNSNLATGASWLCYYKALQTGEASKVIPIDKMSVVLTLILAFIFLHEQFTAKTLVGIIFLTTGTILMIK